LGVPDAERPLRCCGRERATLPLRWSGKGRFGHKVAPDWGLLKWCEEGSSRHSI